MTNGWPSASCSFAATTRAAMSVAWPGVQGTITFTGWLGYDCASAALQASAQSTLTPVFIGDSSSPPILERAGVGAAVEQEILAGDEAGLRTAQISAGVAELRRIALPAGRNGAQPLGERLFFAHAALFGEGGDGRAIAIGEKEPREQVVDGHVVSCRLARQPGDEAREPRARAVREAEHRDRRLYRAGGDVDDAPVAPRDHLVHRRLDELDRRE